MALGLLWSNVGFATVEEEDALIKSGEIKVGMTFHDFSNLGILFNETRIVIPTQKEIEKKKFGRKHALVSKKSNSYYIVSYLGYPFAHENIYVFKGEGRLSSKKNKIILVSIHKRSQKDFYSQFSNYDTWLEVEEFINKDQGHSFWKRNITGKYSQFIDIAKKIDSFVRTEPENGFKKFVCTSKSLPIEWRHSIIEINFPRRIYKHFYKNFKIYEESISYLDDRKFEVTNENKLTMRISGNKLIDVEYKSPRECLPVENFSITDIVKKENPKNEKIVGASGTAFFIDSIGNIITNHHVIDGCKDKSQIIYNNKKIKAKLIAKDEFLDLALLKVDVKNKNFINISTTPPKKLQRVIVAGYPFGLELSNDLKFNSGIITSLKGLGDDSTRLQIDAAVNPGNSGGPIVYEENGELAAVAVAGLSKDKTEAVNFGIKASSVINFLQSNQVNLTLTAQKFNFDNDDLAKLLESSTVYTFCK